MLGHESPITKGRNKLVSIFPDQADATDPMFIDANIGFDPSEVQRMVEFDEDIVAGMYPLKILEWDENSGHRARRGEHQLHCGTSVCHARAMHVNVTTVSSRQNFLARAACLSNAAQ
jgi:hypothetical protein